MNIVLENDIIDKVTLGEFRKAEMLVKQISYDELERLLLKIGYDYGQSIIIYAFICYLIKQIECIEYHFIAESILCNPLCHLEGAYNTALCHNKRILEIEKQNIKAMTMMLFYRSLPTPLIGEEEAKNIAYEILKIEPNNIIALQFM